MCIRNTFPKHLEIAQKVHQKRSATAAFNDKSRLSDGMTRSDSNSASKIRMLDSHEKSQLQLKRLIQEECQLQEKINLIQEKCQLQEKFSLIQEKISQLQEESLLQEKPQRQANVEQANLPGMACSNSNCASKIRMLEAQNKILLQEKDERANLLDFDSFRKEMSDFKEWLVPMLSVVPAPCASPLPSTNREFSLMSASPLSSISGEFSPVRASSQPATNGEFSLMSATPRSSTRGEFSPVCASPQPPTNGEFSLMSASPRSLTRGEFSPVSASPQPLTKRELSLILSASPQPSTNGEFSSVSASPQWSTNGELFPMCASPQPSTIEKVPSVLQKSTVSLKREKVSSVFPVSASPQPLTRGTIHSIFPVRYVRRKIDEDDEKEVEIHLGHDIWISLASYECVIYRSKTPSKYVRKLAIAVFGKITLAASSVTGRIPTHTKKGARAGKPALDPFKYNAVQDCFKDWLQENVSPAVTQQELGKLNQYLSSIMQDLNRTQLANLSAKQKL